MGAPTLGVPAPRHWPVRRALALFSQLVRIGSDDLGLSLVINDLSGDADPRTAQRDLGGPEFLAMIPVDDRGEDGVRMRLAEVQQRRLRLLVALILGGNHHTAHGGGFSNVGFGVLGAEGRRYC